MDLDDRIHTFKEAHPVVVLLVAPFLSALKLLWDLSGWIVDDWWKR